MKPFLFAQETASPAQPGFPFENSGNTGLLQIHVVSIQNNFPIQNAKVTVLSHDDNHTALEELSTEQLRPDRRDFPKCPSPRHQLKPGRSSLQTAIRRIRSANRSPGVPAFDHRWHGNPFWLHGHPACRLNACRRRAFSGKYRYHSRSHLIRLLSSKNRRAGDQACSRKRGDRLKPRGRAGNYSGP